jgi:hypothetical protein
MTTTQAGETNKENVPQQNGPSGQAVLHPDVMGVQSQSTGMVQVSREELERLRQELSELKEIRGSGVSGTTRLSQGIGKQELSERDLKTMGVVLKLTPPEGKVWAGDEDTRSMKRFIAGVVMAAQSGGLDARATFFYLIHRCLDERTAKVVSSVCHSAVGCKPDYEKALDEAEECLSSMFSRSNRTDKFTARFESNDWYKDVSTLRDYYIEYMFMLREADVLGLHYDLDNRRRLFLKGLPEELYQWVTRTPGYMKYSVNELLEILQEFVGDNNKKYFKRKPGVRSVTFDEVPQVAAVGDQGVPRRSFGNNIDGKTGCFVCGGPHLKRNCPKRPHFERQYVSKETNAVGKEESRQEMSASREAQGWSMSIMAAAVTSRTMSSVKLRGASENASDEITVSALLDSGADLSLCRRSFANRLRERGMVIRADWHKGEGPELLMADGSVVHPLGMLDLIVEGRKSQLVVLDSLCTDLIVGKDIMRDCDDLLVKLIAAVKDCPVEEAKRICRVAVSACEEEVKREIVEDLSHCVRDPAVLRWKEGAKESLPCNLKSAFGEARSLEARLRRNNPNLLSSYEEILKDWEDKKWLVETDSTVVKYCLRHFPVARDPNGQTAMKRCRIVVEGSKLTPLLDVDECSHKDMLAILLRWRTCDKFVSLDVSQAYMRIGISDMDSYYLCIAWKGRCLRFRSLPMGISPSASILQETVDRYIVEWESMFEAPGCYVKVSPYMDDLLTLIWKSEGENVDVDFDQVEGDAKESLTALLKKKRLDVSESKTVVTNGSGVQLGVPFSSNRIGVTAGKVVAMKKSEVPESVTRSQAAGWLGTLFDPLGLFAELGVQARLIASSFSGIPWKHPLPKQLASEAVKWTDKVMVALKTTLPRKVVLCPGKRLFVFSDASSVGYGAMVVGRDVEGKFCRFYARGKVYKKHQKLWSRSSSKIELLALKLGVSIVQYLRKVLCDVPYWKDAEFVFGMDNETNCDRLSRDSADDINDKWERQTLVEVANVMAKIGAWVYHVPGGANPSDELSRGHWDPDCCVSKMTEAVEWFKEERAFKPVKMNKPVEEEFVSDDDSGEELALVAATAPRTATELDYSEVIAIGLTERYAAEAGDKSRAQWMLEYQMADPEIERLFAAGKFKLQNGVLVSMWRQGLDGSVCYPVAIPKALKENALATIHQGSGHLGSRKCISRARDQFWWKGMGGDVRRFCNQCHVCQQVKGNRAWTTEPGTLAVTPKAWHVVGIDTVRGLSQPVLTMTCLYTKYTFAAAIPNEGSKAVCEALNRVFLAEGGPALIVSDNAQGLTSRELKQFLDKWNTASKTIPRYAPWYGGWYERGHLTLMKTLSALVIESGENNWKKKLQEAVFYYNTRPFEFDDGVGLSPHEVFRGRKLVNQWVVDEDMEIPLSESRVFIAEIIKEREKIGELFEEIWKRMREVVRKEMERRQRGSERYEVGDYVYVFVPPETKGKLDPAWIGPFRVDKVLSSVLYQVGNKIEHNNNLKRAVVSEQIDVEMEGSPSVHPGNSGVVVEAEANIDRQSEVVNDVIGVEQPGRVDIPMDLDPVEPRAVYDAKVNSECDNDVNLGISTDLPVGNDMQVDSNDNRTRDIGVGESVYRRFSDANVGFRSRGINRGTQDVRHYVHRAVPEDDVDNNDFDGDRLRQKRRIMTRSQTGCGGKRPKLSAVIAMVLAYQPKGDLLWL